MAKAAESVYQLKQRTAVEEVVDRGDAHPSQADPKNGFIRYLFLGGPFDGATLRLYPPFNPEISLCGATYVLGPPKDKRSPKLTYRLKEQQQ